MLSGWRLAISKFFIIPHRVILSIMGFLSITFAYTMRTTLSLAITKMVVPPNSHGASNISGEVCYIEGGGGSHNVSGGEFEWSQELQGLILSSFYWGYVVLHIPAGILSVKFGGKWTLIVGMFMAAIFTLITPIAVQSGGSTAILILRVLVGAGEGVVFPANNALLAQWAPVSERSILSSLVYSGGQVGSILGSIISGALLDAYDGYASVFYFFGGISILWCLFFALLCYNTPESHPFISDSELAYLQKEISEIKRKKEIPPTPWKQILTSPPMLALIIAQIGHNWGFFTMVTDLPKYMNDVLKFSIKENGVYSALPYVLMWIVAIATGFLSDYLTARKLIDITVSRKLFTAIAAIGPGIFMVGASYAECDRYTVVALFTVGMGFMGTFYSGIKVNNLDLAPNYAGIMMALTNGIGGLSGIVAPYIVGVIATNSSMLEWRTVFWIALAVFVVTTIVYVIWGSAELQPWNTPLKQDLVGVNGVNISSDQKTMDINLEAK